MDFNTYKLGLSCSGCRYQIRDKTIDHRPSTCLGAGPRLALTIGNDRGAHQHLLATPDGQKDPHGTSGVFSFEYIKHPYTWRACKIYSHILLKTMDVSVYIYIQRCACINYACGKPASVSNRYVQTKIIGSTRYSLQSLQSLYITQYITDPRFPFACLKMLTLTCFITPKFADFHWTQKALPPCPRV